MARAALSILHAQVIVQVNLGPNDLTAPVAADGDIEAG